MPEGLTDGAVVRRVLKGDVEAFGILVDRYQNEYAAYARYMTGSLDEAADIMQESFVRAYKSLSKCRDPDAFNGWLFQIVSNQCKTHLRRVRRRSTMPLSEAHGHPAPDDPGAKVEGSDRRQWVYQALLQLPPERREILVLKYVEELSVSEIGFRLSISPSAVKMRLLRARDALRDQFAGVDS